LYRKQKTIDLKKFYSTSLPLKLISFALILVYIGTGSISIAYLFIDSNSHPIEHSISFENETLLDEIEKELDDNSKIVFVNEKYFLLNSFEVISTWNIPLRIEHIDICTPPPKQS